MREDATSDDGKSIFISRVLNSSGLQKGNGIQNSNGTVGRGSVGRNDTVLSGKSKRKPTGAFKSVIENLLEIQRADRSDAGNVGRGLSADDIGYSLDEDGEFDLFDLWKQKNKEFGTIKKGENPTRDIDVPKKISKKDVVSRFARTALEAGITPDTAVSEFERRILDGTMTHEVIINKKAINKIKYDGFEYAMESWDHYVRDGIFG